MKIKEILPCVCCDHIPNSGDSVYYGMPQLKVAGNLYEAYCPNCGIGTIFQYDSAYHALTAWNALQRKCRRMYDNPFVMKQEEDNDT